MRQAEDKKQPSNETLKKQGHGGCFGRDGIKLVWILLTNPIRTPPPLYGNPEFFVFGVFLYSKSSINISKSVKNYLHNIKTTCI